MSDRQRYLLDNRQSEAGERFAAMAEIFDPVTFRHLDRIGVGAGWRCWEVGAGGPGVAVGLMLRVGPTGLVLATDVDTAWLTAGRPPVAEGGGYQVLCHDVAAQEPPPGPFDLVHARLVLVHLAQRELVLRRMVRVLRPGGWLLVEDADPALQPLSCPDECGPEQQLANRVRAGFRALLAERGADLGFGRTLPRLLRAQGLQDVRAEGHLPLASPACSSLEAATVRQLRHLLLDRGLVTAQELDRHLANVAGGEMELATAPLISAWGRKPGGRPD